MIIKKIIMWALILNNNLANTWKRNIENTMFYYSHVFKQ